MRGKDAAGAFRAAAPGITPAYAGKSDTAFNHDGAAEDHPRLCGEKGLPYMVRCTPAGSPPPMRGKVPHSFVHHLSTRITPAYAGKRGASLAIRWRI